jgi:hypothetical protein
MPPSRWKNAEISHGSLMFRFQQKLKNFKQQLKIWNKMVFGNIFQAQKKLELEHAGNPKGNHHKGNSEQLQEEEISLQKQLDERYAQEEVLW